MRKAETSGSIAKFFAEFFAILFVLSAVLVLLLFNAESTLLNAGAYKRALTENRVYEQLPGLAGELTKTIFANGCAEKPSGCSLADAPSGLQAFLRDSLSASDYESIRSEPVDPSGAEFKTLVTLLFPPDEARAMTEAALDQGFAYIKGNTPRVSVPLAALKAHLSGQAGEDFIGALLNTQPACTTDELVQIHAGNAGSMGDSVFCNPPQADLALLSSQWLSKLAPVTAGIPDEAVLIEPSSGPVSGQSLPGDLSMAGLGTLRLVIRLSPLLPLILLMLVTLLVVRTFKDWLNWWGIPLLVSGLIAAALSAAIRPMLGWGWATFILPQIRDMFPASLTGLGFSLAGSVAHVLAAQVAIEAAIIGGLGLAAILASLLVKTRNG